MKLDPKSTHHLLAHGGSDFKIRIWDIDKSECVKTLAAHSAHITSLEFIVPNLLVSGSSDGTLKVWNIQNGTCEHTIELSISNERFGYRSGHSNAIVSVVFVDTMNVLVSGSHSRDSAIRVWDTITWECVFDFHHQTSSAINALAAVANDRLASACDMNNNVTVWNLNNGRLERSLIGHTDRVCSLLTLADGEMLASGSGYRDSTIKIWHVPNGECLRTLRGNFQSVLALQLVDYHRLASSSNDGIRIWNLENGDNVETICGHRSGLASTDNNCLAIAYHSSGILEITSIGDGKRVRLMNCERISYDIDWVGLKSFQYNGELNATINNKNTFRQHVRSNYNDNNIGFDKLFK